MKADILLTTGKPPTWSQHDVFVNSLVFAEAAERLGYETAWLLEHHFTDYGLCPNTLTMAGFVLGRTTQLKVGTAVSVAPLEHPVRLAEDIALLDQLSEGRFIVGFGRGFFPRDYEVFGVDPAQTHTILREWVEIAIQAWRDRTISWKSELIELPDLATFPEPYTKPYPQVYTVGQSPTTIEWAAAKGIPLILAVPPQLESLQSNLELYSDTAAAHGIDPDSIDHVIATVAHVADTRDEAYDAIFENFVWWNREGGDAGFTVEQLRDLPNYRFYYSEMQAAALRGERTVEDTVRRILDYSIVGSPEDCIERIDTIRDATGIDHFAFGFEATFDPATILGAMERFSTDVLPLVATGPHVAASGTMNTGRP